MTVGVFLAVAVKSFNKLFVVSGALEPSGSLVIHFRSWSHAIQSEENHFVGFEDIDDVVDIVKDFDPDFFELFGHNLSLEDDGIVLRLMIRLP